MKLQLATFDFCPYCQRVRIVLEHYGLAYESIHVDSAPPPEWFRSASPKGKVPLLVVDGTPLLESAAIAEFLDEIGGGRLFPRDPIERARVRALVETASGCQMSFGAMMRAPDRAAFESAVATLQADLVQVEGRLDERGPFFCGESFGMADVVFAPLLTRMGLLEPTLPCFPADVPKLRRLAETLAALPEVDRSVDGDPMGAFLSMIEHLGPTGYVASHLLPD